jgi:microcin C transport system substrate-binding protein
MRNMKAFAIAFMALSITGAALAQAKYASAAVTADEKAMAAEKRPDFNSPPVEDKSLKVPGLPETLTWYTSKPSNWGSARAKKGGTFKNYVSEYPDTFRTVGPNANHAYRQLFLMSPGLLEMNYETKEFMPALATHWAFGADGKTAYYKLNERAKWSDGKPVKGSDYLFLIKMMRSENIQDPWYNEYYATQIVDVKAYGDWTVSVTANAKMGHEDLLLSTAISPRPEHFYGGEIPADYVDQYQWKAEPTAGPYYLAEFEKGESLTFRKVKDWWGHEYGYNKGRFNFDAVSYKLITGGNDVVKNYFYKGELEQFYMLIPSLWADESANEQFQKGYIDRQYCFYVPTQGATGIFLNTKDPLLSSEDVRKGLYYAINIQKMIDTVLRGEYARFHNIGIGHAFAGVQFDDDSIRKPDFDPAKARALFGKAGFSSAGPDGILKNAAGDRLAIELIYQTPNHTDRIAVLKEEAKKAGLEIDLKLMQQGAFAAVSQKKFQAWWGGMSTSMVPDYWEYFHSANAAKPDTNNFWGYADPKMDELLDSFRASGDLKEKAAIDFKVQRIVDEGALVVPTYYVPYYRGGSWKWIRYPAWLNNKYNDDFFEAMAPNSGYGAYFGFMWADEAIRKEVQAAMKAGKAYEPRTYMDTRYKVK